MFKNKGKDAEVSGFITLYSERANTCQQWDPWCRINMDMRREVPLDDGRPRAQCECKFGLNSPCANKM